MRRLSCSGLSSCHCLGPSGPAELPCWFYQPQAPKAQYLPAPPDLWSLSGQYLAVPPSVSGSPPKCVWQAPGVCSAGPGSHPRLLQGSPLTQPLQAGCRGEQCSRAPLIPSNCTFTLLPYPLELLPQYPLARLTYTLPCTAPPALHCFSAKLLLCRQPLQCVSPGVSSWVTGPGVQSRER